MSWVLLGLAVVFGLVLLGVVGVVVVVIGARARRVQAKELLEAMPPQRRAGLTLVALAEGKIGQDAAVRHWPVADDVPELGPYLEYLTIERAMPGVSADGAARFRQDVQTLLRGEWDASRFPMGLDPDAPDEDEPAEPSDDAWMATIPLQRPDPGARDVNAVLGQAICAVTLSAAGGAEIDGGDDAEATRRLARSLSATLGAGRFLTDRQRAILHSPDPVGDLREDLALEAYWYGDVAAVLFWALGLLPDVPPPSAPLDQDALMRVVPMSQEATRALLGSARLRPRDELLAMYDRLRDDHERAEDAVDPADSRSVIARSRALERHRAIRWLVEDHLSDLEAAAA